METKPAFYTSEFWFHVLLQIVLTLNSVNIWNFIPEGQKWASVLAQAILGGFYVVGRGIAKNKGSVDPNLTSNYTILPTYKRVTNRNR